ncbi:MAG: LPS export ABC transporter periplasmic protein LptC [Acidobacteriota bacterium]
MTLIAQRWLRFVALVGALVTIAYLVSYFVTRRTPPKLPTVTRRDLTPDIEVVSNDFRYLHKEGDSTRLILQAERDTAFVDGRHKLESIELKMFDVQGQLTGKLTAETCDYDPTARVSDFRGNVVLTTAQDLIVETESVRYDRESETATTSDAVRFVRGRVSGEASGAQFDGKAGQLVLEKDLRVTVAPEKAGQPATVITAGRGEYLVREKRLVLRQGTRVAQRGDTLAAQNLMVQLDDAQRIRQIEAQTGATLQSAERGFVLTAHVLVFDIDPLGGLTQAIGTGQPVLRQQTDTERREVTGERLEAFFTRGANASEITRAQVVGNACLRLEPVSTTSGKTPEQKKLQSDTLYVTFAPGGQVMQRAEADGAATLTVTPLAPTSHSERKILRAPRLTADFYSDGKIQTCLAAGGVDIRAEPTRDNPLRFPRKITSERAEATFDAASGELARIVQTGQVAFEEGPRHARAEQATFIRSQENIELRGREKPPVVWDETLRVEARELDLSTAARAHVARGNVRVTYYEARQTGNVGMFGQPTAPVFITAHDARFEPQWAVFTGEACCWQGDSFVRGDRLELSRADRRLTATGRVATAFYRLVRNSTFITEDTGVFGAAQAFTYSDVKRQAHYAKDVKLTQGSTTLTADEVEIELAARENQLERMTATNQVVIVQPGRRVTGDLAQYTAADDRYVVVGNLARVEDVERGVSVAPEISFVRSEGSVRAASSTKRQRIRTTYQLKP